MGYPRRAMAADEQTETAEPPPCSACRGTGQVISNLGGSPSTLPCPWCEGTGRFIADHDAQAARRDA
jgi:DnaJ-class molecular chaperone